MIKFLIYIVTALAVTCFISLLLFGAAMIFTKKITVYPFSGFEGQLLFQGEPAAFAKVRRTYNWDGILHEENTTADELGLFSFESVSVEIRESLAQFSSSQKIYVDYNKNTFEVWVCGKIAEEEFGEFGGKPSNLTCELTNEQSVFKLPRGYVGTLCTWQTEHKSYIPE